MTVFHLAILPGDGIGPEVIHAAIEVLRAVEGRLSTVRFSTEEHAVGAAEYLRRGDPLPAATVERIKSADAILLGAMGLPDVRWPNGVEMTPQIDLREQLDLYNGVRPIRLYHPSHSPLRAQADGTARPIDMVIVRENCEGLFSSRLVPRPAGREIGYWSRFNTALPTSAQPSIAQEILNLRDDLETQTSAEGRGAIGNRRFKANLFTRYDVSFPPLRGLYLGGGYRYQSKMLIGRNVTTGVLQYAEAVIRTDALIGYRFRLPRQRGRANIQLNIDNVLDDTDPVILRRTEAGFVRRFSVAEPRTYRLGMSVQF